MAKYVGPNGLVEAHQLDEEVNYPSGNVGLKGDWVVNFGDGDKPMLIDPRKFSMDFVQKYPRAADGGPPEIGIEGNWVA